MLLRLPLQFTALQGADLKPAPPSPTPIRNPYDPNDYVSGVVLYNSGAAGVWSLRSDVVRLSDAEAYEEGSRFRQIEREVGLCVLDRSRFIDAYGFGQRNFDWVFSELVFRTPSLVVGPYNPVIRVLPVIRTLPNGVGRGVQLSVSNVRSNVDAPNWIWSGGTLGGVKNTWAQVGALGSSDVDWDQVQEFQLFDVDQKATDTFRYELSETIRVGLLNGSYTGLRISLRYSDEDLERIFADSSVGEFKGQSIQFANNLSRAQLLSPFIELGSDEQKLDRSSSFIVDEANLVGINFSRQGVPDLPPEAKTVPPSDVRALLLTELNLLYEKFEIVLNDISTSPAPLATILPTEGRFEAEVAILPELLDQRLVDLLGLTTELDPAAIPPEVEDPSTFGYNHPLYYDFWHSEANAAYREDKRFVDVLGSVTLREALLEGSQRFKINLRVLWQVADPDYEGTGTYDEDKVLGKTDLAIKDWDPFGSEVSTLVNDIYPRITTVGLKRSWSVGEMPQRVNVFIDDRPPQQLANATLRRTLNSRTSALFDDLAWGIVWGAQIGAGNWMIEPSEHTLCSHDGRYHWFWFDPVNCPRGTWRFEFVRLNSGSRLRQINAVDFSVS
jgi:hypothetical protein